MAGCTLCTSKKVTCPAFNEPAFAQWFPYQENSRLVFKNSITADTFSYTVSTLSFSAAFETTRGGFENKDYPCEASAYITSSNYDNSSYGTLGINYTIVENTAKELTLRFNNAAWKTGEIMDTGFVPSVNTGTAIITAVSSVQNLLFDNGINYQQIVVLTTDTVANKTDRAYKLFIAKNIGIIGCEMYPSRQKWVIQ